MWGIIWMWLTSLTLELWLNEKGGNPVWSWLNQVRRCLQKAFRTSLGWRRQRQRLAGFEKNKQSFCPRALEGGQSRRVEADFGSWEWLLPDSPWEKRALIPTTGNYKLPCELGRGPQTLGKMQHAEILIAALWGLEQSPVKPPPCSWPMDVWEKSRFFF